MNRDDWKRGYLRISPHAALKVLEQPCVYSMSTDELYEIDRKALDFLSCCDGTATGAELTDDSAFVEYCIGEGILEVSFHKKKQKVVINHSPRPSLRYLEIQLLNRCNLRCLHCYLNRQHAGELSLEDALAVVRQFAGLGGLRLLISGGEPLMYPCLQEFLRLTADLGLRRVLLTNGTLIDKETLAWLDVEEIQFSLDGWRQGHDFLRGEGAFDRTLRGIEHALQCGRTISLATMIHSGNLREFEQLKRFASDVGAVKWGIDVPVHAGSLRENSDLSVSPADAAAYLRYAYGGAYHGPSGGYACGRHLMTVLPTGRAVKCGFYEDRPLGDARRDLCGCWLRLEHIPLSKLECRDCAVIETCGGGCRFRASHRFAPDPVMCSFYGVACPGVSEF